MEREFVILICILKIEGKNISPDHRNIPRLQQRVVSIAENYFQEIL